MEVCKGGSILGISEGRVHEFNRTESLDILAKYCSEFLIHAADVEGLCRGIDEDLVKSEVFFSRLHYMILMFRSRAWPMGQYTNNLRRRCERSARLLVIIFTILLTLHCYEAVSDLQVVDETSNGKVDLTFGR